ncbi:AmpG family muropeptide MFS transporter [Ferrimonas marina]|uniref:MFS transporter, PAT family, beta-lactamase induction signal transducer AmpG n=1 Tax=Ferrimonas marina TaxID=299255 RepID=A0A1M5YHJ6_9GAMM|nr:MFS transporter [Ferrimonas marina]SHI11497.1 MFS transporter, PAT family, beta-lactamase induction signal transducer AmpG [Ferrimonas marina]
MLAKDPLHKGRTVIQNLSQRLGALKVYAQKRVLTLLALGFSSGLPLALVFGTLSFWLREAGIERATIGFISWVALAYSFKFLWAPLVDRLPIPGLTARMGRRRSWLLLSQLVLAAGLATMAQMDPQLQLSTLVGLALVVAFASATQDIAVDAFRIEAAPEKMQAALAAAYQMGYRLAMIFSGAGALAIAAWADPDPNAYRVEAWQAAYWAMAASMGVGILATLLTGEPQVDRSTAEQAQQQTLARFAHWPGPIARLLAWGYSALIAPFVDFFQRYGKQALVILALIACYRISDIVMGVMANVFYVDMGFSKAEVAAISKVYGVIMTLLGAAAGGALVFRFGTLKILFIGAILVAGTNLLYALQAQVGYHVGLLTLVIAADNFAAGIATSAFIAYLSSLTNLAYSATQYALLSSMMLLFPKYVAGFSGVMVDAWGYSTFFIAASAMGLPVLLLIALVARQGPLQPSEIKTAEPRSAS